MTRRVYIDWLRGLAVAIMVEAHTVDAWTRPADKLRAIYPALRFIAGWAAPLFLFLAGVSLALSGAAKLRKRPDRRAVGWSLQKRGWQVFGYALVFRVYSFVLAPGKRWDDTFAPDILNVMGLALVVTAFCWGHGQTRRSRLTSLAVVTIAAVVMASLAAVWSWPAVLPARIEAYLRPNGFGAFALFPWAGFVSAGAMAGEFIAATPTTSDRRFHLWLGAAGLGLAAAGYAGSFVPSPLAGSSFWTTSMSWFLIRVGASIAGIALAWVWEQRPTVAHWSPMLLFGRTSLFVYWLHVEIVYGFMTYPLRGRLSIEAWAVAFLVFTAMMLGAAALWSRRAAGPLIPEHLRAERHDPTSNFTLRTSNIGTR